MKTILPPQTIGIIGGGQLGRMMAINAKQMGYRIASLDPTPNCPLAQVADHENLVRIVTLKRFKNWQQSVM